MRRETRTNTEELTDRESDRDDIWSIALAAAGASERVAQANQFATFALADDAQLRPVPEGDRDALIAWQPGDGWQTVLPANDPRQAPIDLYLPICSATAAQPVTVGHLGQSLDGFIAMHAGESCWVTGEENILHLHRLRALCDAVVVGAGTVAADDPQLTTRRVAGPSPVRVVLDPARRLGAHHRVFSDDSAETVYVCARSLTRPGESHLGLAAIHGVEDVGGGIDVGEVVRWLRGRGRTRIFVEGGGVTVSMFLEANLLDRLHLAIAPLIIGDGRPGIRLPPPAFLGDCHRPRYRVFRMGTDVLFDCDLSSRSDDRARSRPGAPSPVTRVI